MTTKLYVLARELGVKSSEIVKKCQEEGLNVQNHMATISSGMAATIRQWFTKGKNNTTLEKPPENQLGECKDCLHFLPKQGRDGLCRKYPPRVVPVPATSECLTCWPQVRSNDACGEFEVGSTRAPGPFLR
jgi:hypothetical protein